MCSNDVGFGYVETERQILKVIAAGSLNKQVDLQALYTVQDTFGSPTETWLTIAADVWAKIRPLSSRETIQANQQHAETTHEITIRYRRGVTHDQRLKYGTRYFHIQSIINEDEENEKLILLCVERS